MANFNLAIGTILEHEGGYVNDPNDPGGETKFGISKRTYSHIDIKNLTLDQAKAIYKTDFWDPIKGDSITDQALATAIFDFAVNAGVQTATLQMQTALGVKADGVIGPKTLEALNKSQGVRKDFAKARVKYYVNIVKRRQSQIAFLESWMNRTIDLV
jgi:lysozyme family protein